MEEIKGLDLSKLNEDYGPAIFLAGIPVPPTDNQQYKNIIRKSKSSKIGYKSLRVKSDAAVKYKKQFSDWSLVNMQSIIKARKVVALWKGTIELQLYVAMEEKKLLTLDNRLKRNDASNRDKNLQDCLAGALLIDDTRFNVTRVEKVVAVPSGEQVVVIMKPKKLRTLAEVYQELEAEVI